VQKGVKGEAPKPKKKKPKKMRGKKAGRLSSPLAAAPPVLNPKPKPAALNPKPLPLNMPKHVAVSAEYR
jgi:hypothetical protein